MRVPFQLEPPSDSVAKKMEKNEVTSENYDAWAKNAKLVTAGVLGAGAVRLGALLLNLSLPPGVAAAAGPALNMVALVAIEGAGAAGGVVTLKILEVVFSYGARLSLLPKNKPGGSQPH